MLHVFFHTQPTVDGTVIILVGCHYNLEYTGVDVLVARLCSVEVKFIQVEEKALPKVIVGNVNKSTHVKQRTCIFVGVDKLRAFIRRNKG